MQSFYIILIILHYDNNWLRWQCCLPVYNICKVNMERVSTYIRISMQWTLPACAHQQFFPSAAGLLYLETGGGGGDWLKMAKGTLGGLWWGKGLKLGMPVGPETPGPKFRLGGGDAHRSDFRSNILRHCLGPGKVLIGPGLGVGGGERTGDTHPLSTHRPSKGSYPITKGNKALTSDMVGDGQKPFPHWTFRAILFTAQVPSWIRPPAPITSS